MDSEPGRPPLRSRAGGVALLAVGVVLCGALLVPSPDRERLVAQGVAHALAAELDAPPGAPEAALLRTVGELLPPAPPRAVHASLWVDGTQRRSAPIERALRSQWNRFRHARPEAVPALDFAVTAAPPSAGVLALELRIATAGDRVQLGVHAVRGERSRSAFAGEAWPMPGRASLLPPLLALLVGLLWGRTLLALFVGVAAGAILRAVPESGALAPLQGLWDVFAVYLWAELFDGFRLEILGFIAALLALVGVVTRAGGLQGLMDRVLLFARSARSSLLLTYGMGLAIFFDDYANCVLVGNTMRPLTDRMRVSREKLAYVVDSTAAPLAAISLLSTWIAFQVSVYSAQLPAVGIEQSGYAVFLMTLPYRFYCLLTLFFVLAVILSGRDFGPMARAEQRARATGQLVREGGGPLLAEERSRIEPAPHMTPDWRVGAFPLLATLAVTLASIFVEGGGPAAWSTRRAELLTLEGATGVLLEGSGAGPLLHGALGGLGVALWLAGSNALRLGLGAAGLVGLVVQSPLAAWLAGALPDGAAAWLAGALPDGAAAWLAAALLATLGAALGGLAARRVGTSRPHLPPRDLAHSGLLGSSTLAFAVVLLLLAWMIGAVCRDLATADYLVALCSDALPPASLPVLLFAVASLVAFATGSSWTTMSILLPNVVALASSVGEAGSLGALAMVALCISAVLEGSVFGDHCSPISDTTVLSSVAAGSDHLDHVRTQAPYALLTAAAALALGYAPLLWVPFWGPGLALASGAAALLLALFTLGRRIPDASLDGSPPPLAPV